VARALAAAVVASLLAVSGAGGAATQQTPKRGGTVVIAGGIHVACLNPLSALCGDRQASSSGGLPLELIQTLEGDFQTEPDLTYQPDLLSSVTWTRKPPYRLTYRIRPGARWSDGVPVTASDFVFSFKAFLKMFDLLFDDPLRTIRRVQALDAKTFRVTLRSRSAQWHYFFFIVLPRHALVGQDLTSIWQKGIDDPSSGRAIGTGPFLVRSFDQLSGELTLVRNPRYWGPHKAYLDQIIFRDVQDPIEAIREGAVDLVPDVPQGGVLELRQAPGVKVVAGPGRFWEHFEIRIGPGGNPLLRKRSIRQALAYGIDRAAIVRKLFGDVVPAAKPIDSAIFLKQSPNYRANWQIYSHRPAEARKLLERTGCRRGMDGIYVCGGERLSLRFVTTAGNPNRQRTLELVQAQLRRVGIEVTPVYAPPSALFGQILPSGDFDVILFALDFSQELFYRFSLFGCGGGQNYSGYCNAQVTRDLRASRFRLDQDARATPLNRVDVQMARDVPVIPLYQRPHFFAYRASLHGVRENLLEGLNWNSEDWWLAERH
jgi:peptide/nickel transport system substrate-binding protein